jgi:hypothetical protein
MNDDFDELMRKMHRQHLISDINRFLLVGAVLAIVAAILLL